MEDTDEECAERLEAAVIESLIPAVKLLAKPQPLLRLLPVLLYQSVNISQVEEAGWSSSDERSSYKKTAGRQLVILFAFVQSVDKNLEAR